MRATVVLLSLTMSMTLTVQTPGLTAPADAWLIVPGQSLGPLRLGVPVRALQQVAGWAQPDRTHTAGSINYLSYHRHRVTVATRDGAVVMLLTTNEQHRTERGVAVGQAVSAATGAYGASPSADDRVHWYDALGLLFVSGGGTIIRIGVYDPKAIVRVLLAEERPARDVFLTVRAPSYGRPPGAAADAPQRLAVVTVSLKNTSRSTKALNPNFFTLMDRSGKSVRYDPSTFLQAGACRSSIAVRPGETVSCTLAFALQSTQQVRSIIFDDGASTDEVYF